MFNIVTAPDGSLQLVFLIHFEQLHNGFSGITYAAHPNTRYIILPRELFEASARLMKVARLEYIRRRRLELHRSPRGWFRLQRLRYQRLTRQFG